MESSCSYYRHKMKRAHGLLTYLCPGAQPTGGVGDMSPQLL